MFEKVPNSFKLAALVGVLLAGPATLFAFLLGGPAIGAVTLVILAFFFVVLYMIAVRKYG